MTGSSARRVIGRSGLTTRAAWTACAAMAWPGRRGAGPGGRSVSNLASISRSSTSLPIRLASWADEGHKPPAARRDWPCRLAAKPNSASSPDRRQRSAQLMAGVGDEPTHPVLGFQGPVPRPPRAPGTRPRSGRAWCPGHRPADPPRCRATDGRCGATGSPPAIAARRRLDPAERRQAGAHERQPDARQHRDGDHPGQRIRYLQVK